MDSIHDNFSGDLPNICHKMGRDLEKKTDTQSEAEGGASPLACPPVRLGSQLTVRGTQSSVLDRPAFLSPSLIHPRAGTRYMKKGPTLDPRAGEKRPEFSSTAAPSHDKITAQFHHTVWTLHFLTRTQVLPFQACWSKIRHPCYVIISSSDHIFQTKKSGQIV